MTAAPGLPVGIAGLPPLLAQMSRGRAYAADVAGADLAAALAAGTLAQNFVQKRPSAAIAGEGLPDLLESLRRRDIDVHRAQARGLMRFFRAQPDWTGRRRRAGGLQFLDELDHFGIDSLGLLVVDSADGLFDWENPAALREQGLRLRSWCASAGCTLLLLFRKAQLQQGAELHRASRALSGIATLGNRRGELIWEVSHWRVGAQFSAASQLQLRTGIDGGLVATGSDEVSQWQARAWLANARDQDEVYITRAAAEPALPASWRLCNDDAALLQAAQQATAATCILDAGRPQEFRSLAHHVHELRKRRGRALKIIVRQSRTPLRHGRESILLTAGANLILDPGSSAAALAEAVSLLHGQVLSRDVPDQLEQVLASAAPPSRSGYLPPLAFCHEVQAASGQAQVNGIECTLVRLVLRPEVSTLQALQACKPLRAGDVFTADDRSVYLFLFACWEHDAEKAVERVFRMMIGELFVGQLRMPGHGAIEAEAGDLQYRAEVQALTDFSTELSGVTETAAFVAATVAAPVPLLPLPAHQPQNGGPRSCAPAPLRLRGSGATA